jgi:isopropylmalate/homocitrate/citramalate synthase
MGKNLRDELKNSAKKTIFENANDDQKNMADDYMKKYGNKNENELMNELFNKVKKNKAQGTFSDAELDNFAKSVKGMLSPQQQKKMEQIIKSIKNG